VDATIPRSPKVGQTAEAVTPSAIVIVEEKMDSSKPVVAKDKGKGPAKIVEAKKAIEDDTPVDEGPFDQELGGQRYRVHHAARKVMCAKQLPEAICYAKQLGCPSRSTIFGGGPNDYLYCCLDNLETKVCHHMVDNIGFSKLEAMLSTMSSEDFYLPDLHASEGNFYWFYF
jgi:hypothetical protein